MKYYLNIFIILFMVLFSLNLFAENVIVARSDSVISELSKSEVKKLFLGKTRENSGVAVNVCININSNKEPFLKEITGKSLGSLKRYFLKESLAGKGATPKYVKTDEEMVSFIKNSEFALGFVNRSKVKPFDELTIIEIN